MWKPTIRRGIISGSILWRELHVQPNSGIFMHMVFDLMGLSTTVPSFKRQLVPCVVRSGSLRVAVAPRYDSECKLNLFRTIGTLQNN
jgi:hypothetical protein